MNAFLARGAARRKVRIPRSLWVVAGILVLLTVAVKHNPRTYSNVVIEREGVRVSMQDCLQDKTFSRNGAAHVFVSLSNRIAEHRRGAHTLREISYDAERQRGESVHMRFGDTITVHASYGGPPLTVIDFNESGCDKR